MMVTLVTANWKYFLKLREVSIRDQLSMLLQIFPMEMKFFIIQDFLTMRKMMNQRSLK